MPRRRVPGAPQRQGQGRIFRTKSELAEAVEAAIPAHPGRSRTDAGLLQAYRALVVEAASTLSSVLGWSAGVVRRVNRRGLRRGEARAPGSARPDGIDLFLPDGKTAIAIAEVGVAPKHPLATHYREQVLAALHAATFAARALSASQRRFGPRVDIAFALLAEGIDQYSISMLLRSLLEASPSSAQRLDQPFAMRLRAASTVLRWLTTVPANTYEGEPLRTGIVVCTTRAALGHPAVTATYFEGTGLSFEAALTAGQVLALADGAHSFLILEADLRVVGVVSLHQPMDALLDAASDRSPALPLSAVWFEAREPQLIRMFGWSNGSSFQIGHLRRGRFRLFDPRSAEDALAGVISIAIQSNHPAIKSLARDLVARAGTSRGAGVLIGPKRPRANGKRPRTPVPVDPTGTWRVFLGPDGAALVDTHLQVYEYGVMLPQPSKKLIPERGSRHNAVAAASAAAGYVGVAISDDGSLTVFQKGRVVLSFT